MQVQHYEFILIREIDKLLESPGDVKLMHLREKLTERIKQNDRYTMLYQLSAKEIFDAPDISKSR